MLLPYCLRFELLSEGVSCMVVGTVGHHPESSSQSACSSAGLLAAHGLQLVLSRRGLPSAPSAGGGCLPQDRFTRLVSARHPSLGRVCRSFALILVALKDPLCSRASPPAEASVATVQQFGFSPCPILLALLQSSFTLWTLAS